MVTLKNPSKVVEYLNDNPDYQGALNVKLYPDFKSNTTVLNNFKSILNYENDEELIGGSFLINDKKIQVKTNLVNWNDVSVDFVFPDMGTTIQNEKFRHDSCLAITINVADGETFDITSLFNPIVGINCEIAWGDSETPVELIISESSNLSHTYQTAGKYTIFIKGFIYDSTRNPGVALNNSILAIQFVKPHTFSTLNYAFCNLPKLTDVIGTIELNTNGNGASHLFYQSSNINNIKGLNIVLPNKNNVTSIKQIFGASNMDSSKRAKLIDDISFIKGKNTTITNIDSAFFFSDISKLPLKIIDNNISNGYQAFKNCPKLQKIFNNIFEKLENGYEMFYCNDDISSSMRISNNIRFSSLKNGAGMFGNRTMSFDEIKQIFESLPENPNPHRGDFGFNKIDNGSYGDDISISDHAITFCFDLNEKDIREKISSYFKINTEELINAHNQYSQSITSDYWDGGWYPIYNTYYNASWCYNLPNGWAVNFRLPHNYGYR